MSTITMFIAWLLSLVGLQDCDTDPGTSLPDCPVAIAAPPGSPSPSTTTSQRPVNFISNGL